MKRIAVAIALFLSGIATAKVIPPFRMQRCGTDGAIEVWSDGCIGSRDGMIHVAEGAKVVMVIRD